MLKFLGECVNIKLRNRSFVNLYRHVQIRDLQGDNGGQLLHFDAFIIELLQCCQTALQFLPNLKLPKQNQAGSGGTKL